MSPQYVERFWCSGMNADVRKHNLKLNKTNEFAHTQKSVCVYIYIYYIYYSYIYTHYKLKQHISYLHISPEHSSQQLNYFFPYYVQKQQVVFTDNDHKRVTKTFRRRERKHTRDVLNLQPTKAITWLSNRNWWG